MLFPHVGVCFQGLRSQLAVGCCHGDNLLKMHHCCLLPRFYPIYLPDLDILRRVHLWRFCQTPVFVLGIYLFHHRIPNIGVLKVWKRATTVKSEYMEKQQQVGGGAAREFWWAEPVSVPGDSGGHWCSVQLDGWRRGLSCLAPILVVCV